MSETKKAGGALNNKWMRAAIPGLLLHCSIGTVYCWSYVSTGIAEKIGFEVKTVNWAFSLAILFLGMSAAFLGNVVEKDIHKSSLIATICFALGMAGTGFFVWYGSNQYASTGKASVLALVGIFLCYGVIMGIGLGTGYLSPVKTLMLWFQDRKGLAIGLAVAGFGAAKAIGAPIMEEMQKHMSIDKMFYILAAVYFVMMFTGHLLLKKPEGWHEPSSSEKKPSIMEVLKTKPLTNYIGIWLMFFLNITCGLAIISYEKQLFITVGFMGIAGTLGAISAVFNAGGRLGFSAWADTMKDRNTIYKLIFILSIVFTAIVLLTNGIVKSYEVQGGMLAILVVVLIMVVNAGYGGGFSNVPTLLSDHYGMGSISAIHGITLSAWGFAGIAGPQLTAFIIKKFGETDIPVEYAGHSYKLNPLGMQHILIATVALYVISLLVCLFLVKPTDKALEAKKAKASAKNK